jgi:hypothetical protein
LIKYQTRQDVYSDIHLEGSGIKVQDTRLIRGGKKKALGICIDLGLRERYRDRQRERERVDVIVGKGNYVTKTYIIYSPILHF